MAVAGSDQARKERWTAALGDRRLLALVGGTIALSLALSLTSLSGRALPLLGWGVLVYLATATVWATATPESVSPGTNPSPAGEGNRHGLTDSGTPAASPVALRPLQIQPDDGVRLDDIFRLTEEALRRLNNPAALGRSALTDHLPLTLKNLAGADGAQTPAIASQALRAALVQAIDRLKPGSGPAEQNLYSAILRDEYVLRHSTARIMTDYSISESTLHRYRRDAIQALAYDLAAQEAAITPSNA